MIDPDVRSAGIDDLPELQRIEAEARTTTAALRGGRRWLAEHAAFDWPELLTSSDAAVFVAELRTDQDVAVIVGYGVVRHAAPVAMIEQVFVEEPARELGFGDALVEAIVGWARSAGCGFVEALALPGDRHTKNLYERAGITARLITVSRALE